MNVFLSEISKQTFILNILAEMTSTVIFIFILTEYIPSTSNISILNE